MAKYVNETGLAHFWETIEALHDCFVDNITAEKYRTNDTDCYTVTIPLNDSDGNIIEPYMAFSTTETPMQYAQNHGTTFTCNGTLNLLKTDNTWQVGNVISRGEVIYASNISGAPVANDTKYLSINQDRSFTEFPISTTAAQMLAAGAYNVFTTYYKLVENGAALDLSGVTANETGRVTDRNPNLALGYKSDKTLVFFACDGRTNIDAGLTSDEVAAQMVALGCSDAWMLDGGGSTSLNYQCSKMNRNIDGDGTVDRAIRFTFNVKKEDANDFMVPAFAKIGAEKQRLIEQLVPAIYKVNKVIQTTESVLDLCLTQTDAVAVYFYTGTDTSWTPANEGYTYGIFVVERAGLQRVVTAYKYNGRGKARISYANDHWYYWTREPIIERGVFSLSSSIAPNSTAAANIPISNPFDITDYTAFAQCENTSWAIVSIAARGATQLQVTVRNLNTSTALSGLNVNWQIIYD